MPTVTDAHLSHIATPLRALAVPISSLNLDPSNARKHDERNLAAIKGSLARFGQRLPLVVQKQGLIVRAGNGRLLAAKELGWTHVAAVVVDESEVEATAFAIADNQIASLAEWDDEALAKLLQALPADLFEFTGFNSDDLGELLDKLAPEGVIEDEIPEPPENPITQPGDLWILGNHRLLCGDSGSAADLDRLLDGAPIHLANCDPPYNVKVEPRGNAALLSGSGGLPSLDQSKRLKNRTLPKNRDMVARDRILKNDFLTDEEFERRLNAWFGNISRVLIPGGSFYIWGGSTNCGNYPPALKANGLFFHQAVIWVKEHPALTRRDFMSNHEWCFYGWKEGAAHRFLGPSNITDTWSIKKISPQAMIHLTEKPVELAARAIQYSSRRGENVLDLFGGSGSTLMAAEQCERKAFLMELDAPYADVIVQRWEKATGRKADRIPATKKAPESSGAEETGS